MSNQTNIFASAPAVPAGGVSIVPQGVAIPTDAVTELATGTIPLGIINEEGITLTPTVTTVEERAWGGQVVKVIKTEASVEGSIIFHELMNEDVLRIAYGEDAVVVTPATSSTGKSIALKFKGELPGPKCFVIDAMDGNARVRVVLPSFQVTEPGEIVLNSGESSKPGVTAVAQPDASGVLMYIYMNDGRPTTGE